MIAADLAVIEYLLQAPVDPPGRITVFREWKEIWQNLVSLWDMPMDLKSDHNMLQKRLAALEKEKARHKIAEVRIKKIDAPETQLTEALRQVNTMAMAADQD